MQNSTYRFNEPVSICTRHEGLDNTLEIKENNKRKPRKVRLVYEKEKKKNKSIVKCHSSLLIFTA